jgi:hypothetical protein
VVESSKVEEQDVGKMPLIKEVWIFLATDDDGDETMLMMYEDGARIPLIAADQRRIDSLMPEAESMAFEIGREVRLVKFSTREVVKSIKPTT